MQIKEVSKRTDLTIKTIRFYEARGLITPPRECRNGRYFRNYREEDVNRLQMVAVLRKCLFSIEQIKTMLEHPELTPDVFTEYRNSLLSQRELLDALAKKAETVEPEGLENPEMLARLLSHEAKPLPLPKMDIKPRFRYLDEFEEQPMHVQMQENLAEDGGHSEATRLVIANRYGSCRHFWDIGLEMLAERPVETVPDQIDRDSRWLRRLKSTFMVLTVILFVIFTLQLLRHPQFRTGPIWGWLGLLAAAGGIRALLEFFTWRRDRKYWV